MRKSINIENPKRYGHGLLLCSKNINYIFYYINNMSYFEFIY